MFMLSSFRENVHQSYLISSIAFDFAKYLNNICGILGSSLELTFAWPDMKFGSCKCKNNISRKQDDELCIYSFQNSFLKEQIYMYMYLKPDSF